MWKEFKEFAFKGNIMDLAVAVIIGGAFGKIVSSFVADIIMPLVGLLTGGVNFANLFITLGKVPDGTTINTIEDAVAASVPTLNYGLFITHVIDFLIIAIFIFIVIKMLAKANAIAKAKLIKEEAEVKEEEPTTKTCQYCKTKVDIEATRCPACTSQLE